jgi:hypothetical protein
MAEPFSRKAAPRASPERWFLWLVSGGIPAGELENLPPRFKDQIRLGQRGFRCIAAGLRRRSTSEVRNRYFT